MELEKVENLFAKIEQAVIVINQLKEEHNSNLNTIRQLKAKNDILEKSYAEISDENKNLKNLLQRYDRINTELENRITGLIESLPDVETNENSLANFSDITQTPENFIEVEPPSQPSFDPSPIEASPENTTESSSLFTEKEGEKEDAETEIVIADTTEKPADLEFDVSLFNNLPPKNDYQTEQKDESLLKKFSENIAETDIYYKSSESSSKLPDFISFDNDENLPNFENMFNEDDNNDLQSEYSEDDAEKELPKGVL